METTDTALGLVLFFTGLIAGLAVAFVGLCAAGVSSDRIGRGFAQILFMLGCVPVLRRVMAVIRRHRKAVVVFGGVVVIGLAPSVMAVALLTAILVIANKRLGKVVNDGDYGVSSSAADARGISGVLVDHGAAPYLNNTDNSPSYYVELMRGDQTKVVWGVGLADAIGKSGAGRGDAIALTHTGREAVKVPVVRPEVGFPPIWKDSMRNRWDVMVTRKSGA